MSPHTPPEDGWDHFKQDANRLASWGLRGALGVVIAILLLGPVIVLIASTPVLQHVILPIAIVIGLLLLLSRA